MIEKLTRWSRQRAPEQTPPNKTASIRVQRRKSERLLTSVGVRLNAAERRRSLPILQRRSAESKALLHARKAMAAAADTLNVFPPERRREMLRAAEQLPDFQEAVRSKWIPMSPDEQGDRYRHLELRLDEEGNVFVAETIRRTADDGAHEGRSLESFSAAELQLARAQLKHAAIWQAFNSAGFHEPPPDYGPLRIAPTLSVD
jgi:hypothetical protein